MERQHSAAPRTEMMDPSPAHQPHASEGTGAPQGVVGGVLARKPRTLLRPFACRISGRPVPSAPWDCQEGLCPQHSRTKKKSHLPQIERQESDVLSSHRSPKKPGRRATRPQSYLCGRKRGRCVVLQAPSCAHSVGNPCHEPTPSELLTCHPSLCPAGEERAGPVHP